MTLEESKKLADEWYRQYTPTLLAKQNIERRKAWDTQQTQPNQS